MRKGSHVKAYLRLVKRYGRPHLWTAIGIILVAMLASTVPYVSNFLGKTMVDEVIIVGPQTQSDTEDVSPDDPSAPTARCDYASIELESSARISELAEARTGRTKPERIWLLLLLIGGTLALHGVNVICSWINHVPSANIGNKIGFHLRKDLHNKLQQLQMSYFDKHETGKLMARMIDDVQVVQQDVTGTFVNIFLDFFRLILGLAVIYALNWKMALLATFLIPLFVVSNKYFAEPLKRLRKQCRKLSSEIYSHFQQRVTAVRVVKGFGQEKRELRGYLALATDLVRRRMRTVLMNTLMGAASGLIMSLGFAFILYVGALEIRAGRLTLGELLMFYSIAGRLFAPAMALSALIPFLRGLEVNINRIFEILDEPVTIADAPDAVKMDSLEGDIRFRDVSLTYDAANAPALKNINLEIKAGSTVAIMGPSGSGKTSLVNLIQRLYEPTEGTIEVASRNIRDIRMASLRRHVGLVPQETALFSGTIREAITYGHFNATDERVEAAAREAEIHDFIVSLPKGYQTMMGERGVTLSGGQKQRISLARALLTDPIILVLDACTSALDAGTEARIQQTLSNSANNRTSFVITHRLSMAAKCDKIIVLEDGEVAQFGTNKKLLSQSGPYRRIHEQQNKGAKRQRAA